MSENKSIAFKKPGDISAKSQAAKKALQKREKDMNPGRLHSPHPLLFPFYSVSPDLFTPLRVLPDYDIIRLT